MDTEVKLPELSDVNLIFKPKPWWKLVQKTESQSGSVTAHLTAGEDTLVVVNKMLLEKGYVEWEAVPADDHVLQLDMDLTPPEVWLRLNPIMPMLSRRVGAGLKMAHYVSKSGQNTHVIFALPSPMALLERMAWQAILGSDPKREALNLIGLNNGVLNQVLLFMPRDRSDLQFVDIEPNSYDRRIKDVE